MNKLKPLILVLSLLPFTAIADEEGFYAGAGLGLTKIESEIEFLQNTTNNWENGYRLFVGYDFNPNWSVELGFTRYGEGSADLIEELPSEVEFKARDLYLSGFYHWNFAENWSADFKLGVQRFSGKTELVDEETCRFITSPILPGFPPLFTSCESDDRAWGVVGGIGATWSITEHVLLRGTLDLSKIKFDDDGDDFSGNLESDDLFQVPARLGIDVVWKF